MQLSHKFESQREWQIKSKHIRNYDTIIRDGVKPEKNSSKKLPLLQKQIVCSKSVPWSLKIGTWKSLSILNKA